MQFLFAAMLSRMLIHSNLAHLQASGVTNDDLRPNRDAVIEIDYVVVHQSEAARRW